MSDPRDDQALRGRFQELRAEVEQGGVPDFRTMVERARAAGDTTPALEVVDGAARPSHEPAGASSAGARGASRWIRGARGRRAMAGVGVSLAAAALAGVLLVERAESSADAEFERLVAAYAADAAGGAWRSPTASLLEVPGPDLGSVPSIQGAGSIVPPPTPTPNPEGRDS